MKKLHWLNLAEYASLVGLGVGTVASIVSQQLFFTSAPLSFLVLLNFANRRRLESLTEKEIAGAIARVDQKVNKHLELLHQQITVMPSSEAVGNIRKSILRKNREGLEQLAGSMKQLQQDVKQRLAAIEKNTNTFNSEELVQLAEQYNGLSDALKQITAQIHRLSNASVSHRLEEDIAQLRADITRLQSGQNSANAAMRPSWPIQDQIHKLQQQVKALSTSADAAMVEKIVSERLSEMVDMMGGVVQKREWSALVAEVQALHRHQESQTQTESILRQELAAIASKLQHASAPADLTTIRTQIKDLQQRLETLPPPVNITGLSKTVERLVKTVKDTVGETVPRKDWDILQEQFARLQRQQEQQQQKTQALRQELAHLHQQLQEIPGTPQVRSHVEQILRQQLQELGQQLHRQLRQHQQFHASAMGTPSNGNGHHGGHHGHNGHPSILLTTAEDQSEDLPLEPIRTKEEFQSRIAATLQRELDQIKQEIEQLPDGADYEFVFRLNSDEPSTPPGEDGPDTQAIANDRTTLEAALQQAKHRLILIWPWSNQVDLDDDMLAQFHSLLERGCRLDLGWCHLADRTNARFLSTINQRWAINPLERGALQETLQKFLQLKRQYPQHFQFKILGTLENFFVVDQQFAVMGINDTLITQTAFPNLELKLRTTVPQVIQRLVDRFDQADLEPDDIDAYWNRAVTRYDLGDKQGALADFSHIISQTPKDALAYNYRGVVRYDLGDKAGAFADLNDSLKLDSHQPAVYCNRGLMQAETGDQQGAIADYTAAINIHAGLAIAFFYRGLSYQKLNNATAALTNYNEAIHLAPDAAIAYYHRAMIGQKLGDRPTAISDFEQAIRLFEVRGSYTNAQHARASLAKLQAEAN